MLYGKHLVFCSATSRAQALARLGAPPKLSGNVPRTFPKSSTLILFTDTKITSAGEEQMIRFSFQDVRKKQENVARYCSIAYKRYKLHNIPKTLRNCGQVVRRRTCKSRSVQYMRRLAGSIPVCSRCFWRLHIAFSCQWRKPAHERVTDFFHRFLLYSAPVQHRPHRTVSFWSPLLAS